MTAWGNPTPTEERRVLVAERNRAVADRAAVLARCERLEAELAALRARVLVVAEMMRNWRANPGDSE